MFPRASAFAARGSEGNSSMTLAATPARENSECGNAERESPVQMMFINSPNDKTTIGQQVADEMVRHIECRAAPHNPAGTIRNSALGALR
jgi:hypothetical protein